MSRRTIDGHLGASLLYLDLRCDIVVCTPCALPMSPPCQGVLGREGGPAPPPTNFRKESG